LIKFCTNKIVSSKRGGVLRESLKTLLQSTLIYQYSVENQDKGIPNIDVSTQPNACFNSESDENLIELIYNSILEYSFNEFELHESDCSGYLNLALKTKIKYDDEAPESEQLKYGFYGEVLLNAMLHVLYKSKPIIARGYFYNPLENSETKGYDAYHLIEHDGKLSLWFGEVKFREKLNSCVDSVIAGVDKAFSDKYLNSNLLALVNYKNSFSIKGSKVEKIIQSWMAGGSSITLFDEFKKNDIEFVYPILLVYSDKNPNYDERIRKTVENINEKFNVRKYSLSIPYSLFFILVPIDEVRKIKKGVLECISSRKQLLS
jgi:hypothetical protein